MISLIIPLFNRQDTIVDTLESIQNQTCQEFECIVVDDDSTDNSFFIVFDYIKDKPNFKLTKREEDYKSGGNGARNYGFQIAKGEFINFIDSDDILHVDFVKDKLYAIRNTLEDVVISKTILTSMDINEVIKYETRTRLSANLLNDFITLKISWYISDPVWRKNFLKDKKLFDEDLLKGQDRDFHIRMLLENPKIKILDKYLYYYRNNPNSISELFSEKVGLSMLKVGLKRSKLLVDYGIEDQTKFFILKQLTKIYSSVFRNNNTLNLYIEAYKLLFKFNFQNLIYTTKFILAIFTFKILGKGEKLLK